MTRKKNSLSIAGDILPPDLSKIPTDDLKRELANAIGITARTLSRLAEIWSELERRGEDLSHLRGGLMSYLPLIAEGRLDPELVVRCAGQAMLLKAASNLTLAEQRTLIEKGAPVIDIGDGENIAEKRVPVESLSAHHVRQVFAGDRLRTPAEQVRLLGGPERRSKAPAARGVIVKVRLTRDEYDHVRSYASRHNKHVPTLAREIILDGTK